MTTGCVCKGCGNGVVPNKDDLCEVCEPGGRIARPVKELIEGSPIRISELHDKERGQ
jgi:hypothetical protein